MRVEINSVRDGKHIVTHLEGREWFELISLLILTPAIIMILIIYFLNFEVNLLVLFLFLLFTMEFMIHPLYFRNPSIIKLEDHTLTFSRNFKKRRWSLDNVSEIEVNKVKLQSQRHLPRFIWTLNLIGKQNVELIFRRGENNQWVDVIARCIADELKKPVTYQYWEGDDRTEVHLIDDVDSVDQL